MDDQVKKLFEEVEALKAKYENHFDVNFPNQISGWWDPLNIVNYPEELEKGIKLMSKDVHKAIETNKLIEEIPDEEWSKLIF